MYKILIIDDNHSFVDSLKVMLNEFPFQYESEFRYADAEKEIRGNDTFLNREDIDKIVLYQQLKRAETLKKEALSENEEEHEKKAGKESELEKPTIKKNPINDDGYLFIFIEQDTERNIKGLEFIKNIINTTENYRAEDFILFSTQPEMLSKEAARTGVFLVEKPIKYPVLKQYIKQRIKKTDDIVKQCNSIMESHKIEIAKKEKKPAAPIVKNSVRKTKIQTEPKPKKSPSKSQTAGKKTAQKKSK